MLSLFADGMAVYLNDSDDPKRKLLDLINTFAKVAYKITTFLRSNNRLAKKKKICCSMKDFHTSPEWNKIKVYLLGISSQKD